MSTSIFDSDEKVTEEANPQKPKVPMVIPNEIKKYDKVTIFIWKILWYMKIGDSTFFANMYATSPMLYNFMLVGASGAVLQWILYEGIFRSMFSGFLGLGFGTFVGTATAVLCVFFWNFIWNKKWSLSIRSQILKMKPDELDATLKLITEIKNQKGSEDV